jgi:hypothetical protein
MRVVTVALIVVFVVAACGSSSASMRPTSSPGSTTGLPTAPTNVGSAPTPVVPSPMSPPLWQSQVGRDAAVMTSIADAPTGMVVVGWSIQGF